MNYPIKLFIAGASMIIVAGITACEKEGPAETAGRSIDQAAETIGDKMSEASKKLGEQTDKAADVLGDAAVTAKVRVAILAEPDLSVMRINVDTSGGITTLSGSADSQKSIDRAVEIAGAVIGVSRVENKLMAVSTE